MINATFYLGPDGKLAKDLSRQQIADCLKKGEGLLWVDLEDTGEADRPLLSEVFGFHDLAVDDCISTSLHHPKIDDYDDHLFIIIHGINYHARSNVVETTELAIFLGHNYVVSSHNVPMKAIKSVMESLERSVRLMQRGADFLAYNLMDVLVDNIISVLDKLNERSTNIENEVLENPRKATLNSIMELKRSSLALRRVMTQQRQVINSLSRGDFEIISEPTRIYYRDVYDHVMRVEEFAQNLRDLLDSALNTYLSSLSNRMNEIMKVLTLVASIFIPLTLIAGIYGMNFDNMPELSTRYGYFVVLGVMAIIGIGLVFYFRKRRWM